MCHKIGRSNKACFLRRWFGKFTVQWISITIAKICVAATRRVPTFHTALNNAKIPSAAAKIFCALWPFLTPIHIETLLKYFIVNLSCANLFFVSIMFLSVFCRLVVGIRNNRIVLLSESCFEWYHVLNVSYFVSQLGLSKPCWIPS